MNLRSRLPDVGTTIFSVMSQLALDHGAINLSQGFPDFALDPALLEHVNDAMRQGHNQYAPMPGLLALREAIAGKVALGQQVTVDPVSEITITAGATQALFTALAVGLHAGDQALVLDPSYDSYAPAITALGAEPVRIKLAPPTFALDWQQIEDAITPRTRVIIINNPGNPSTRVWSRVDRAALAQLAERHDLLVIADEVYEHLVYDGAQHSSVLAEPALRARSIAVYSFGKTFHATGWKIGYMVAPPAITAELRKLHQFLVFSVHTPAQFGLAAHLHDASHWQNLAAEYQARRDRLATGLSAAGFDLLPCAGTYFQLASYTRIRPDLDELAFAKWLTSEFGVASIPLSPFYGDGANHQLVRFCFAKRPETLDAAIARLAPLAQAR